MKKTVIRILENELWWGGVATPASEQAYGKGIYCKPKAGEYQSAPLYLSSQGRYIWANSPLDVEFCGDVIIAEGKDVELVSAGTTLRDAYLAAMKAHFPFEDKALPEKFFRTAQYNTWMEFTYNPTQKSVLEYAHAIVDNGYTPGILIIDEGWHIHYGVWEFDFVKFPDPKAMVDELHALGFTVMLWLVPYVTADGRAFLEHYLPSVSRLMGKDFEPRLLRDKDGKVAILRWWNGYSAMLDMTEENDRKYLEGRLRHLMEDYGIDGFKFDGGNIHTLRPCDWVTAPPVKTPEQINKAWNEFGSRYEYHEYKDTYGRGGRATIERILDRNHSWENNGLNSLIPVAITQGLLGYPYVCPDMIGGGQWVFNLDPNFRCDEELFVRMAQCSALFPMMQFSWAPWRLLGKEAQELCLKAARLHAEFADTICALVRAAAKNGEPIIRSMEYSFPHKGYERIYDQFMLGDDILVCPVVEKGARTKTVYLPEGKWKFCDGRVYDGGVRLTVEAPLDRLPYFEKME